MQYANTHTHTSMLRCNILNHKTDLIDVASETGIII